LGMVAVYRGYRAFRNSYGLYVDSFFYVQEEEEMKDIAEIICIIAVCLGALFFLWMLLK